MALQMEHVQRIRQAIMIATCAVIATDLMKIARKKKKKRSVWCKPPLLQRSDLGMFDTVASLLQSTSPDGYMDFLHMTKEMFNDLLMRLAPVIRKENTHLRVAISPEERLVVTLRYLASGMSYHDLASHHKIAQNSLSSIIPETCQAIYNVLREDFLKIPDDPQKWRNVAQKMNDKWNIPNCVGALDGRQISIQKPARSGSSYASFQQYFSVVLLAIVDPDFKFLVVHVGAQDTLDDGAAFESSGFADALERNTLNLPKDEPVYGMSNTMPYVVIGNDNFPLTENIMRTYSDNELTLERRVYNYRLSRVRRLSENAFGILASQFCIFQRPIQLSPEKMESIVLGAVTLHNYLIGNCDAAYFPVGISDTETIDHNVASGSWRHDAKDSRWQHFYTSFRRPDKMKGLYVREQLTNYFCSEEGEMPWQLRTSVKNLR